MTRIQRGSAAVLVAAVGALLPAACRKSAPSAPAAAAPPRQAFPPKQLPSAPPPHPVLPPDPNPMVHPAPAFCEERDLHTVALSVRHAHQRALQVARRGPAQGAPPTCHDDGNDKELMAALNALIGRTGVCVARDAALDPQWSQLESAVAALDRCMDCTRPRAERVLGCRRTVELTDAAQKATR